MKIAIICGSQRPRSQTAKVGHYLVNLLQAKDIETVLWDLGEAPLSHFDDTFWSEPQGALQQAWQPYREALTECDALIALTPDWHGMVPSVLKNFFLYCGTAETANKPGLIVSVSSASGGYLPVAELRISSSKNNRICWIPDHLVVRNVKQCFNAPEPGEEKDDQYIQARTLHSLRLLIEYAKALKLVRDSEVADYKTYPFGM
ncbi:NADPH-dependent FMN reductase [Alteromonas lipolytica]|uniref:NADPH-dependent FMN reductase-like domain-containing protein n=1 Tax=Alteromonas lipolytica TaxID=1856405 RepID=A0A1E8FKQ3_9ALTE|nr:NAD(P)H-dependent oxidoreductase [Alteromonas lipolytica]OFI36346.1 hypothetical protein BFC17_00255 [Alteromonas lipolytica]GGF70642.1 FMN reductase [Alteromonas lipolytica]